KLRVSRTIEMMDRTDLALLIVSAADMNETSLERLWLEELKKRNIPVIGVLSQIDRVEPDKAEAIRSELETILGIPITAVSANSREYRAELLSSIVKNAPIDFESPTLVGDLFKPGTAVVLVAPQDIQAPKGRLILPQVQVIRDILDNSGLALTATLDQFPRLLDSLKEPPGLVITDSQAFPQVNSLLPRDVPLTSFSIVMARSKGDLGTFVRGARAINSLKENDRVLVAEACTHAPLEEDIGREKLPRWLRQRVGPGLTVDISTGLDFPANLKEYSLILHCGGCMFTRKQLMSRLIKADAENVPITNYGVAIAAINGILERTIEVFPEFKK
ncbi:MAG: [FeFe] hydrogenase H-cluster maturation GTPase HydF, partial [Synergistaceae bacterium]|nr:[FeFe] hydrogenase H-cluster maturation GTPase HydF [Synergistaceae bacterium]